MTYRQAKTVFFASIAVTAATMAAGLAFAGMGHKDIADKFLGPALLVSFGLSVTVGAFLNYRYVGRARDNWGGYSSQSRRRFTYLAGIVLVMVAGVALMAGGVLLLLVKNSSE